MQKVVAFLEKYAEWLGLGVACLFLLYVVYGYVVSPDQVRVKVGSDAVYPGSVDPKINETAVNKLQAAIDATSNVTFPKPDFAESFARSMGPDRERMTPEVLAGGPPIRPAIPGVEFRPEGGEVKKIVIDLPKVPTPVVSVAITGNSMVAAPAPLPAEGADPQAQPEPVQPEDPALVLANAIDKKWITVEAKFDTKALVAEWKKVFFDGGKPLPVPPQVLITHFLQLEVEREEQTGPDQWGNTTTLKPLPLIRVPEYPKPGDREGQEIYRLWAEQHQVELIEPAFFRVLKGDPWYIPSIGAPKDPSALADATAADQPFDPANPGIPREKMTPQQRQQVYIYEQQKKAEEQKAKAAERKSKTDAAESSRRSSGGGNTSSGGGRKIGGYAPLPIQLAANPGVTDDPAAGRRGQPANGGRPARPVPTGRENPATPGREVPRGEGRTREIPPGRELPGRGEYGRSEYGRTVAPANNGPTLNPDGMVQNSALTAPFDPTKLPLDVKGAPPEIIMWAHDDTAQAGKTYRYRMRVKLKNPLYNTFGLTKTPEDAAKFALESDWSGWKEVTAPRTTEFFFATMRQQVGTKSVSSVTVDIFRHEKGEWSKETFVVSPGDGIGGMKGNIDYSTGATLVDLRPDTREKDLRIMISDDVGNLTTVNYQQQLNDPWYQTLKDKIARPAGVGTTPAAAAGNPAYINEVGGR